VAHFPSCRKENAGKSLAKKNEMKKCFFSHIFHLWKAFREYHFVLRGPIQNEERGISCGRNDHFVTTPGKKLPHPNGLEASFLNSATSMWEVLPKWNL